MASMLVAYSRFSLLVFLSGWMGCAVDAGDPAENAPVTTQEEEIIGGYNSTVNTNFVALYHRAEGVCEIDAGDRADGFTLNYSLPPGTWWPRPCGGTIIRKDGNANYILTARHCLTKDGKPDGAMLPSGSLRVIGTLNPGVIATDESDGEMLVTGSPPAGSVAAAVYYHNLTRY